MFSVDDQKPNHHQTFNPHYNDELCLFKGLTLTVIIFFLCKYGKKKLTLKWFTILFWRQWFRLIVAYLNYAIDKVIKNHMERYSFICPICLYLYCHKHAVQVCAYCTQISYIPWYAYQSMFFSYSLFHYCISFLFSLCTFSTAGQIIKYFVDATYPYIEEYNYSYNNV